VISFTTPSSSASTGISIFIDSRITSVSPSSTSWPKRHSIFQTVPVMCASTSGKLVLLASSTKTLRCAPAHDTVRARVILAIDQGTTGTTCIVFDERGRLAGRAYREFEQHFPRPGWVEHDAGEIWEVTRAVAHEALGAAGIDGSGLTGIGITNQRETVVAWEPLSGQPLHRALVWQDRRTAPRCDELREAGFEPLFRERTGLVLDPYFSGTKIEWLVREGGVDPSATFGTIDSWLAFNLTGRHVTDYSNASRTLLFDIHELSWDRELCELLSVEADSLPDPLPSAHVYGETGEFGGSVPVAGIAGDQQAALYGQACHEPGLGKNTYGTGSFVLENAGSEAPEPARGLLTTVAWGVEERVDYALEASIFVTGAAIQWLRDALGAIGSAAETEELARSLEGNDGVYFVPALTGLGSPHWDPYARGTIVGLTRGTGRAHLARAALESIAYQTVDAVRAMEEASGVRLEELRADGGGVHNGWLMQFQADVLGVPVVVPEISETTALGAAFLAGVATGSWTEPEVRSMWREAARYEPHMSEDERASCIAEWRRAVERSRGWASP
jgi:glycerol kinase